MQSLTRTSEGNDATPATPDARTQRRPRSSARENESSTHGVYRGAPNANRDEQPVPATAQEAMQSRISTVELRCVLAIVLPDKSPAAKIAQCLTNFVLRVHHDRTVPRHGLLNWLTGNKEKTNSLFARLN